MVVVMTATPSSSSQPGATATSVAEPAVAANPNNADFFVSSLACVLTHLVSLRGDSEDTGPVTVFQGVRAPSVSIHDYLFRISRYFLCSPECFVMSLVYIDRIMKKRQDFVISKLNIHRLIVTSVMLAVKFFDDVYYSNAYYGKVGGVKGPEMNVLEVHFLRLIDWHLFVSPEEFDLYKTNVLVAVSGQPSTGPTAVEDSEDPPRHPTYRRSATEYDDEGYGEDATPFVKQTQQATVATTTE